MANVGRFAVKREAVMETGGRFTVTRPSVTETGGRFTVARPPCLGGENRGARVVG